MFHLAPLPLQEGSVILPGNWGRIIRQAGWNHTLAIREMALESARSASFHHFPSRLDCAFAFPTAEEAVAFRNSEGGFSLHVLYCVTRTDPQAATSIGRMDRVSPDGELRHDWATVYWEAMTPIEDGMTIGAGAGREILTLSPLRIEERLD